MRLGLAVFAAAAVLGGYALVNTLGSRPAPPEGAAPAAEAERDWLPSAIDEPAPEARSYELIRYMNKDGSFGMVDDPTRVPPGATILGRERKTVAVTKPATPAAEPSADPATEEEERLERMLMQRQEASRRLATAQRRITDAVLGSGLFPGSETLEQVQGDLDTMQQEADRMKDCADGDCLDVAEPAPDPADDELRSAVPKR
jgi:hypothetical protein